jgi:hypothetical protein
MRARDFLVYFYERRAVRMSIRWVFSAMRVAKCDARGWMVIATADLDNRRPGPAGTATDIERQHATATKYR